ncbi:MAG: flagellar motor protein MotB [Parasporobacterium sp.]|nr:flagellar motor protein MotB [Parasporobacterium sp.]
MAKKKKEMDGPPPAGWMATFSDLMNLLLCFFVLLFSMSTVDETKFEELVRTLSESLGIIEGASDSVLEGSMVTVGTQALMELTDAYETMGINDYQNSQSVIEKGDGDQAHDPTDAETTMKNDDPVTEEEIEEEMQEQSQAMAQDIEKMLQEEELEEDVQMDVEAQYVLLTLDGATLFNSGASDIAEEAIPIVNKVGRVLQHYPDSNIEVIGHTDSTPIVNFSVYADNIDLSFARAKTVAKYLVNNFDLSIEKMRFSGRGEYEPVASNDTEEGRARNRRVEVRIYNELNSY